MVRYAAVLFCLLAAPALAGEPGMLSSDNRFTPAPPKEGYSYPDCFCTDSDGRRVELGQVACLNVGSGQVLARCGQSLNVTTWRRIQDGCPGV